MLIVVPNKIAKTLHTQNTKHHRNPRPHPPPPVRESSTTSSLSNPASNASGGGGGPSAKQKQVRCDSSHTIFIVMLPSAHHPPTHHPTTPSDRRRESAQGRRRGVALRPRVPRALNGRLRPRSARRHPVVAPRRRGQRARGSLTRSISSPLKKKMYTPLVSQVNTPVSLSNRSSPRMVLSNVINPVNGPPLPGEVW